MLESGKAGKEKGQKNVPVTEIQILTKRKNLGNFLIGNFVKRIVKNVVLSHR